MHLGPQTVSPALDAVMHSWIELNRLQASPRFECLSVGLFIEISGSKPTFPSVSLCLSVSLSSCLSLCVSVCLDDSLDVQGVVAEVGVVGGEQQRVPDEEGTAAGHVDGSAGLLE